MMNVVASGRGAPEQSLKVGLLVGSQDVGGTERQVAYLADGLESAGHHVTVFFINAAPPEGRATVTFANRHKVFLGFEGGHRIRPLVKFARALWHLQPDVLHMFNLEAMRLGTLAAYSVPRVVRVGSIRGLRFAHDPMCERKTRSIVSLMARVTVNSEAIAQQLRQHGIGRPDRIICIPNGISTASCIRRRANPMPQVLFAGSLKPVKAPECFVEACLRVLACGVACRVRVAGDGPLFGTLQALAAGAGQAHQFEFLGSVPPENVPYADADVVVSTSLREGTSNTLLEAMAHGVAVVATDVGGTAALMRKGEFGIMVPPGDVASVANAIYRLVKDPGLRQRLGACGATFVRKHFTIPLMVDRHGTLYRSVTRSPR